MFEGSTPMPDDRLNEIELQIAFQEDTINRLNDALVAQQQRIDQLETRIAQLHDSLSNLQDGPDPSANEPPPHY